VPGAFDPFELATRAILGQQVTVRAATTIAGRFSHAFGEPIETPVEGLQRLTPSVARVAAATPDQIARLGIVSARAGSISALARALYRGVLSFDGGPGHEPDAMVRALMALPGIGPWTAHYIAMRALRWPDAFPKEDIAIRKKLGGVSAKEADAMSAPWRPWRSYAVMHLWLT
jgi:AraC family transcriptional regulator of adaptative response / DNA-3-methyladenine glycosylase II